MSALHPSQRRSSGDDVGTITRSVSEDLIAIFGPGIRASDEMPGFRRSVRVRFGRRRQALAAVAAGVLVAAIAAGVFAGQSATHAFTTARASGVGDHAFRSVKGPSYPAAIAASPAPTPVALAPAPIPVAQTAPIPAMSRIPATLSASGMSPAPPSSVTTVTSRLLQPVSRKMAVGVPGTTQQSGHDDDRDEGFASRVDLAEQRLADAYDQAVSAGVRPNILRGYRREWDRARRDAADQPQAALRLYAMITSDFYNLADDAEARDGRPRRW